MSKRTLLILFVSLFALLSFMGLNYHSRADAFSADSQIWADRAGYYVYLPAVFLYNMDADRFPDQIHHKTGDGFKLRDGKVVTKYPAGVALLQSPFFLTAHVISLISGAEANGFTKLYHNLTEFGAAFYACLGMYALFLFLNFYVRPVISITSVLLLFFGTNLVYYTIAEGFMSHMYSFTLFAILLYTLKRWKNGDQKWMYVAAVTFGLIALTRQLNAVFAAVLILLFEVSDFQEFRARLLLLFKPKTILVFGVITFLFLLPQMLYYYYLSGSFWRYSYGHEGFDYWKSPHMMGVLLAPENGLLLYNPIMLFPMAGWFFIRKYNKNATSFFLVWILLWYAYASWSTWHLSCGYSHRSYTDIMALFMLFLALLLERWYENKKIYYTAMAVMLLLVMFNMKNVYMYNHCFFGKHSWDWDFYWSIAGKWSK